MLANSTFLNKHHPPNTYLNSIIYNVHKVNYLI